MKTYYRPVVERLEARRRVEDLSSLTIDAVECRTLLQAKIFAVLEELEELRVRWEEIDRVAQEFERLLAAASVDFEDAHREAMPYSEQS